MASEAITGLGSEGTETERPVWNVAIDGIATRRWQANPFSTSTASAHCTYLKTIQSSPALIHHHFYLHNLQWLHQWHHLITCCCGPIYLQINKNSSTNTNLDMKSKGIYELRGKYGKKQHSPGLCLHSPHCNRSHQLGGGAAA